MGIGSSDQLVDLSWCACGQRNDNTSGRWVFDANDRTWRHQAPPKASQVRGGLLSKRLAGTPSHGGARLHACAYARLPGCFVVDTEGAWDRGCEAFCTLSLARVLFLPPCLLPPALSPSLSPLFLRACDVRVCTRFGRRAWLRSPRPRKSEPKRPRWPWRRLSNGRKGSTTSTCSRGT